MVATLREVEGPVGLRRVDEVVLASAKHSVACHLYPEIDHFSTLGLLEQCVLNSSVVALYLHSGGVCCLVVVTHGSVLHTNRRYM